MSLSLSSSSSLPSLTPPRRFQLQEEVNDKFYENAILKVGPVPFTFSEGPRGSTFACNKHRRDSGGALGLRHRLSCSVSTRPSSVNRCIRFTPDLAVCAGKKSRVRQDPPTWHGSSIRWRLWYEPYSRSRRYTAILICRVSPAQGLARLSTSTT